MNRLRHLAGWSWLALLLVARVVPAATVVWSDGFETNGGSRWLSDAVWKIGSPTAGPAVNSTGFRTHSGTVCAHTQNYRADTDARIVCISYTNGSRSLVVPSADQSPRLRFWHWFNLSGALGFVEISTNGGDWTQLSPTYRNEYCGGVWSRPSIDLSAYAGQSVRFAFRFFGSGTGNGLGWYVDDVEVDTGMPALDLPESFEFDPKMSDWSVDFGTWEIGEPSTGPGRAHTGTNCAGTVLAGNYPNYADTRLVSPSFHVPASGNPILRYWQWYSFNNALGFVELNDNTVTTTTVITTNSTIITNAVAAGLNTNLYQLTGATDANYPTNYFTWDPTIGAWTNANNKALGSVFDSTFGLYYFEGGTVPLAILFENYDYRPSITNTPVPQSLAPTNFLIWQGMTWFSRTGSNNPVGYFGTNYTYSYTTNGTVVTNTAQSSWVQISATFQNGSTLGSWIQESLDLSAYADKMVQIAFHFGSGVGTAAGWYVDDINLIVPPALFVPTNQFFYVLDTDGVFTATNVAVNPYLPNATYKFSLLSPPLHMSISNISTTQSVMTWQISSNQPSSTNTITVVATDNDVPPLSATNSFVVTFINQRIPLLTVPPTQTIYAGQTLVVTNFATNAFNPGDTYTFQLLSPILALTNIDLSDFTNDGVITWPTTTAQRVGTYTNIVKVTDDVYANYSATNRFLIIVSKAPVPSLSLSAQQIYAGQLLDIFITATNPAFPDSVFTYSITNLSPIGLAIDEASGELTWQTSPTNKTQSVKIGVKVTDDHTPPLITNGTFTVTVTNTPAPKLILPTAVTNYAGQQLAVTISAMNVARPDAVFTFALAASSTNYFITNNSASLNNAVLTWTNTGIRNGILYWTNNSVSPRTNTIKVWVQDDSPWTNRATNSFALIMLPPRPPYLNSPTNPAIQVGQTFTNVFSATNDFLPGTNFAFAVVSVSTNGLVKTNVNVLAWTNAAVAPGIYRLGVRITDDSVPPIRTTNTVSVSVLPYSSQLVLTNIAFPTNGAKNFKFSITTPWTNTPWRIEAATNLDAAATDWLSIYTNKTGGFLLFTDSVSTNLLQRYYRAVFP